MQQRRGGGFDDLLSLLDTLVQYGVTEDVITGLKENLKYLKQYIKRDYKVRDLNAYGVNRVCLFIV